MSAAEVLAVMGVTAAIVFGLAAVCATNQVDDPTGKVLIPMALLAGFLIAVPWFPVLPLLGSIIAGLVVTVVVANVVAGSGGAA